MPESTQPPDRRPLVLINFKATREGSGSNAVMLAKQLELAGSTISGYEIILAVQALDIYRVVQVTRLKVFAQHVDPRQYGPYTGSICPFAVREAGACGTLINHTERRLSHAVLEQTVDLAKTAGLQTIVCAASAAEGQAMLALAPDYIGIEPEVAPSAKSSILESAADVVEQAVAAIPRKVLFGGGISTSQEVQQLIIKGASGIMVSSKVVKSSDPRYALESLLCDEKVFPPTKRGS